MESGETMGPAVAAWLAGVTGAAEVTVTRMALLGGGAIQENWGLDVACRGGRLDGTHALVLRTDAQSRVPVSWNRAQEYRILEVAFRAGVTAPEPIALCQDPAVLGRPFYLMRRVAGEARGFKLVRDPLVRERGEALAARLGAELAKLHRVAPPVPGLEFIPVPEGQAALARIAEYRGISTPWAAQNACWSGPWPGWSGTRRRPCRRGCCMRTSAPATIWSTAAS